MKIKTCELTGAALDWAVGEIEFKRLIAQGSHVKSWALEDHKKGLRTDPYSSDWFFGGPIIEREFIKLDPRKGQWEATIWNEASTQNPAYGTTPLIAAMRCYVASKLGDEVDVPEELLDHTR